MLSHGESSGLHTVVAPTRGMWAPLEFAGSTGTTSVPRLRWPRADDPYLRRLRAAFPIADVTRDASTDLERLGRLCAWTGRLWQHDGRRTPSWGADPISIMEEAATGGRFRCVEYSIVLSACLAAVGIPARPVQLGTADAATRARDAGHVIVEAYLPDRRRWAVADAQGRIVPILAGEPLHAVELQQALARDDERLTSLRCAGLAPADAARAYLAWMLPYLFYIEIAVDQRSWAPQVRGHVMLVPHGAPPLRTFQRTQPIRDAIYIHSLAAFYRPPRM